MPRYDLTVKLPTLMEGVPVEVPPIGYVKNGSTVEYVLLSEDTAKHLETANGITVKKLPEAKVDAVVAAAGKAKTIEEVDELLAGEERAAAVRALTDRKVDLAAKQQAEQEEATAPSVESEDLEATPSTVTGASLAESPQAADEGGEK